jgi:hypothetical protein
MIARCDLHSAYQLAMRTLRSSELSPRLHETSLQLLWLLLSARRRADAAQLYETLVVAVAVHADGEKDPLARAALEEPFFEFHLRDAEWERAYERFRDLRTQKARLTRRIYERLAATLAQHVLTAKQPQPAAATALSDVMEHARNQPEAAELLQSVYARLLSIAHAADAHEDVTRMYEQSKRDAAAPQQLPVLMLVAESAARSTCTPLVQEVLQIYQQPLDALDRQLKLRLPPAALPAPGAPAAEPSSRGSADEQTQAKALQLAADLRTVAAAAVRGAALSPPTAASIQLQRDCERLVSLLDRRIAAETRSQQPGSQ